MSVIKLMCFSRKQDTSVASVKESCI